MKLYLAPLEGITGYVFRNTASELKLFTDALTSGYKELLSGDTPVLQKRSGHGSYLIFLTTTNY